jgi:hypothetical protein
MTQDLQCIEYRQGMLKAGAKVDKLPVKTWRGVEIPEDVLKAIHEEGVLELGGVYGYKEVGDPVQYDHLRLILDKGAVDIKFFNRAITLFMTDDEKLRCIHRVLSKLNMPLKTGDFRP